MVLTDARPEGVAAAQADLTAPAAAAGDTPLPHLVEPARASPRV